MRFDPSGLSQAFDRMQKAAQDKGSDLATAQAKQLKAVSMNISRKEAPTREEITAIGMKLKGRLHRRKPGWTWQKELAARLRNINTLTRHWNTGKVENKRNSVGIPIENTVDYSGGQEDKKHILERAMKAQEGRFRQKLEYFAKQVTSVF